MHIIFRLLWAAVQSFGLLIFVGLALIAVMSGPEHAERGFHRLLRWLMRMAIRIVKHTGTGIDHLSKAIVKALPKKYQHKWLALVLRVTLVLALFAFLVHF